MNIERRDFTVIFSQFFQELTVILRIFFGHDFLAALKITDIFKHGTADVICCVCLIPAVNVCAKVAKISVCCYS